MKRRPRGQFQKRQGQAELTSGGNLSLRRHKILGGNPPSGQHLDALDRRPTGPHSPATPLGHSNGMDAHAAREVRTGHFLGGKKFGELHDT